MCDVASGCLEAPGLVAQRHLDLVVACSVYGMAVVLAADRHGPTGATDAGVRSGCRVHGVIERPHRNVGQGVHDRSGTSDTGTGGDEIGLAGNGNGRTLGRDAVPGPTGALPAIPSCVSLTEVIAAVDPHARDGDKVRAVGEHCGDMSNAPLIAPSCVWECV